ncbi:RmlC-like cupin domain-containing protein [Diplogelasinospora grovesii]|uniref:Mannose-6-phosphate isomerase n=1 Tax=Diplogelasinospora grovesii TaxID=303347 RepID=A0AAN6N766_9PEZI|nr:RmlC-like cupin domain-containing protein [Diplogelasinospora grovesii]
MGSVADLVGASCEASIPWTEMKSLLVIGDIVLDEYQTGKVSRVGSDRPIPILHYTGSTFHLGGAANVFENIHSLAPTSKHILVGIIGDDVAGHKIRDLLRVGGHSTSHIHTVKGRPTTHKSRVSAQDAHALLRIDREDTAPIPPAVERALSELTRDAISHAQGVVIADYRKGLLTPTLMLTIVEEAKRAGIPVIVDPKGTDASIYRGATALTPNLSELGSLSAMPTDAPCDVDKAANDLLGRTGGQAVVVTCGASGATVYDNEGGRTSAPAAGVQGPVQEVNGAGDVFTAAFSLALCSGCDVVASATLANIAAGIAVRKKGTCVATFSELSLYIRNSASTSHFSTKDKILTLDELTAKLLNFTADGRAIVFTNGCFDLLHAGHVQVLEDAKKLGGILVVGLNSDASASGLKGTRRPIIGQYERAQVLAALSCVDFVVVFDEPTPEALIRAIRPDVLVKGGDNSAIGGAMPQDLPFLFKVLSIQQAICIQAHPTSDKAPKLHRLNPDLYPDNSEKPEMIVALTPFRALCGLRPLRESLCVLHGLTPMRKLLRPQTLALVDSMSQETQELGLEGVETATMILIFEDLMNAGHEHVQPAALDLLRIATSSGDDDDEEVLLSAEQRSLLQELSSQYPGDIGIFLSILMNYVTLRPGESLFVPAGELHSYISGDAIECMRSSANTIRAGLTHKFRDIENMFHIASFTPRPPELIRPQPHGLLPGPSPPASVMYSPTTADFAVLSIQLDRTTPTIEIKPCTSHRIYLCTAGRGAMATKAGGEMLDIATGHVVLALAGTELHVEKKDGEQQLVLYAATSQTCF